MMSLPADRIDWERQRAFLAVWRTGSLSAAARALNASQPTLRRRIDELERQFGEPLFVRSPGGLAPTPLGVRLVAHAEAMEAAAAAFARTGSGDEDAATGVVRVAASELVGGAVLPDIMRDLRRNHPGLRIQLALSDLREDLLASHADIAVRMAPPGSSDLIARRLKDMSLGLFARADLIQGQAVPRTIEEASLLPAVGYETDTVAVRRLRASGLPLPWPNTVLATDNGLGQLAAIRAGVGMGISLVRVCAGDADLVRLAPDLAIGSLETWLVYPRELKAVRRVRVVADALIAALGRDP